MLLNPELFSITQSKEMGMWPPSDLTIDSMYPYIKRFPNNVSFLDVGIMKGENIFRLFEKDEKSKIESIYAVKNTEEFDDLIDKNLKDYYGRIAFTTPQEPVDIVSINSKTDLDKTLDLYYGCVKKGGIFCGNNHNETSVKESLSRFRRKNRIGTPISVALDTWFWFVR